MWILWTLSHWRLLLAALFCALLVATTLTAFYQSTRAEDATREAASAKAALARVRALEQVAKETEATLEQIRATSGEASRDAVREVQTRIVYRDCIIPASGLRILERARTGIASESNAALP